MPKRRDLVKSGAPVARIKENSTLMRTHESMVDYIKAMNNPLYDNHRGDTFMNVFTSGLFGVTGLDFGNYDLERDLMYSDDDDDDDDSVYCRKPIEPHPRIRQLTDEEADRHMKELIAEEERRKEKTQRNKRKKMRKKEKKRLEKENTLKENLPEEDKSKSDSDNQEEDAIIENKAEADESAECAKSQNSIQAAGCDESGGSNKEETNIVEVNKEEDEEQKGVNLNNSEASATKSVPEETCEEQKPEKERKKEKSKIPDVKLLEEEKPKVKEKTEVKKKKEEKREPIKEKTIDPTVEEYARRSRELAGAGNRLAASGQYEMAVKCFTDAIKFNPKEFRLFGNRSLCYERLQQYENALRDADVALSMEPNWIKGLFRKGKALCGLKKYYEASLIYREVLKLESSSMEAAQELKRAQTLHLMEMGFTWAQSTEALKTHATLEEAVENLFSGGSSRSRGDAAASWNNTEQPQVKGDDDDDDDEQWTVLTTSRPRTQQIRESNAQGQNRSLSHSPTPHSRNAVKPDLFSIWVGSLGPAVTYATLHELFSRVGAVYSIKMLLEQQCAFVNYTRREDCDRAIQCFNGMVLEGAPLSVRYPSKGPAGFGSDNGSRPGPFKKECFFWRTTGCTRDDCTYKHVPEHKNIDRDKFTSRLGFNNA